MGMSSDYVEAIKNSSNKDKAIESYISDLAIRFKLLYIDEMHIPSVCMNHYNEPLMDQKIFERIKRVKIFDSPKYQTLESTLGHP